MSASDLGNYGENRGKKVVLNVTTVTGEENLNS